MPRVRLAQPQDADAVVRLMLAFRDHLGLSAPTDEEMRAGVERLLGDPDTEFLLAAPDADGAPAAGVAQLRFRFGVWRAGGDCLLEDLYVDESARGAGLGRALVEATLHRARARGCRRVELDTNERTTRRCGCTGASASAPRRTSTVGATSTCACTSIDSPAPGVASRCDGRRCLSWMARGGGVICRRGPTGSAQHWAWSGRSGLR